MALALRRWSVRKVQELKLLIIEEDLDQRELIRETLDSRFGEGTVTAVGGHHAHSGNLPSPLA